MGLTLPLGRWDCSGGLRVCLVPGRPGWGPGGPLFSPSTGPFPAVA